MRGEVCFSLVLKSYFFNRKSDLPMSLPMFPIALLAVAAAGRSSSGWLPSGPNTFRFGMARGGAVSFGLQYPAEKPDVVKFFASARRDVRGPDMRSASPKKIAHQRQATCWRSVHRSHLKRLGIARPSRAPAFGRRGPQIRILLPRPILSTHWHQITNLHRTVVHTQCTLLTSKHGGPNER